MTKKIRSVSNTCIIMLVCIGINYMGKVLAADWQLPLWMDSIGTGMSACLLGPFFGALCGATNNILYGMRNVTSYAYAVTSVAIAIVMGICMRRHMIRDWFGVFTTSALVSVVAVVVSTPFNLIFFQGYNGNLWGDALFDMFRYYRIPVVIASVLSELLVDFPDKVVTVCIIFGILGIITSDRFECNAERKSSGALMIGIVVTAALIGSGQKCVAATAGDKYTSTYSQTVYNGENGLIGGEANDIVETKDGYLWIGTYSGLYCFDGSTFDTMSDMKDVKNVNCLFEDEEGRLWIGTNDNGVSIYVRDKISNILTVQNDLASNSIRCIAEDEQGNYYIGTSDALSIVTISNGLKVRKILQEIMYARSIAIGKAGDVAVVNNSGQLFIINNQMIKETFTLKTGNAETFYTCCKYMDNGDLLVGTTTNEMYRLRKTNGKYRTIKRYTTGNLQQISSIASDDQGNYWVCSGSGIGYLQGEKFHTFDTNTFNSSIDNMTMDYQGNLWFTSSRLGLLKLSKTCFTDLFRQYSLEKRVVNTVTKWQDCIYIGTDDGLQIIDEKQQCVSDNKLTRKLRGRRIRCMTVDSAGHLWIAISGEEGLLEVTPSLQITEYGPNKGTISNRFRTVMELKDGTMAASENTGIDFIRNGKVVATIGEEDGLGNPQILCMLQCSDGTILAGSDGSGIAVIRNNKVQRTVSMKAGLTSDVILRIVALDKGYLIITSNGLCYMNDKLECRSLSGFPYSNNYDAMVNSDGKVWILGSAGIYIVTQDSLIQNEKYTYELLDGKRGLDGSLTANAWNYIDDRGNYYLSCNSGVYVVNIEQYNKNKTIYRMWLNDITVDGTKYYISKSETTSIGESADKIEITPILMNYTKEDPYISYYLKGFEHKKNIVRQSELGTIVYTNLPSGTYTFVISILDYTGTKEIESSSYSIEKPERFWETWWFKAYYIIIAVMIIMYLTWLITRLQSNRVIERQNREIELAKKQAQMGNETILAIAKTVDARDENTSQHSERVAEYSVLIAKRMGWSKERCEALRKIALLHDIGKIGIPDAVLNKPSRLTDEEYEIMKSHVLIGGDILKDFTIVQDVADGARYHHERYDGKGYAKGLKGEEIPLNARIIGIADAFDAMTSNRVYRQKMDMDYVLSELRKGSGTQFDPNIVKIMISLIEEGIIDPSKRYEGGEA